MKIMEGSDTSRELLDNVAMAEVSPPFMMQRIGVEPQLLSGELLQSHNGLVVDMTNNEYLPAVNYSDELLGHDLTEEDRNLAAALVAVQLVQQQKQQQLHQDSNVIVSTSSLASLVSSSHLDNGKVELTEPQLVISSVDKPVISNINSAYINTIQGRHMPHEGLPTLKKYETLSVDSHERFPGEGIKEEFISVKHESEESGHQQRDSDCENRNDVRSSKKSLPHKKRISRKLKKNCALSRKAHKCSVCEQIFNTGEELSAHSACHSVNIVVQPNPFSCQICAVICNDQLAFFEHLKTHYEPNLATVKIKENGSLRSEEPKDSLLSSLLPPLNCIHCGKTFRRQKTFEAHMRDAHTKLTIEDDEFSEPEDLMEGIRGVVEANHDSGDEGPDDSKVWYHENSFQSIDHPDLPDHGGHGQICHLCGQVFTTGDEVVQHLQHCKLNHVEPKIEQNSDGDMKNGRMRKKRRRNGHLSCPHCDRVFSHRNSLMYHMRGHTGERPHQCDICGKSFFAASALKVHMRLHSGDKPYKCEFCGRHFRQWGDLKYHCISIHSDQKQYQCEYCGKDFARKYSLIVHRRIHTGEKNYRCEFCGKTFRASSYLQNHRRIHTGEKPHPCEVCGKPFRVRSDMKRHLNTHSRRRSSGPTPTPRLPNLPTALISVRDTENAESIVPDNDDGIMEHQDLQVDGDGDADAEEPASASEESIGYQRDPLETVRDAPNTLFSNGHLLICYPSELPARTMETQWIHTDS